MSRTTVSAAYARLRDLGYLTARRGSGNFVALPHPRSASGFLPGTLRTGRGQIGWNCASGAAAPGLATAYGRAAERLPELLSGSGYLPDGLDDLRERIAQRFLDRGLDTDPAQIVVTTGALSAFTIVASTVLRRGERLLLESPTYPNAIEAARRAGIRPVGYPLPDDGWQVPELSRTLDQTGARAAYLIPDHHNPTGQVMSDESRAELAGELRRRAVVPIIDETLVELGLESRPRRPFAAFHPDTITLGSASKAFSGRATGRLDPGTEGARSATGRDPRRARSRDGAVRTTGARRADASPTGRPARPTRTPPFSAGPAERPAGGPSTELGVPPSGRRPESVDPAAGAAVQQAGRASRRVRSVHHAWSSLLRRRWWRTLSARALYPPRGHPQRRGRPVGPGLGRGHIRTPINPPTGGRHRPQRMS